MAHAHSTARDFTFTHKNLKHGPLSWVLIKAKLLAHQKVLEGYQAFDEEAEEHEKYLHCRKLILIPLHTACKILQDYCLPDDMDTEVAVVVGGVAVGGASVADSE